MGGTLRLVPAALVVATVIAVQFVEIPGPAVFVAVEPAPQILGVMASAEPLPMTCADGTCRAELTTFCLQSNRPVAELGTPYRLGGGGITLVVTLADRSVVRVPVDGRASLATSHTYTSATLGVTLEPALAERALDVGIVVAARTSLVPVERAGMRALLAEEVDRVTGHERGRAARVFDSGGEGPVAVDITNRLINRIPTRDRLPRATRDSLWRQVVGRPIDQARGPGEGRAAGIYRACRDTDAAEASDTLRACLVRRHHKLVSALNKAFWTGDI